MPPTPKSEDVLRKRRDARARKTLFLLVPLLVLLAAWQGPKVMDQISGAREKAGSTQGKVVQGIVELSPSGVPVTTQEGTTGELAVAGSLSDTDPAPEPAEGTIVSFTRFTARDPFVQLVVEPTESESTGAETTGSTTSSTSSGDSSSDTSGGSSTDTSDDGGEAVDVQATIRVNGTVVVVSVGDEFPESDPAFTLVAIEDGVARIGLVSGAFSNGVETLDLEVGDTVTLISQPDGARFTIKLLELG